MTSLTSDRSHKNTGSQEAEQSISSLHFNLIYVAHLTRSIVKNHFTDYRQAVMVNMEGGGMSKEQKSLLQNNAGNQRD